MTRIRVALTVLVATATSARAEEFSAQILHNDYTLRHGTVELQLGPVFTTKVELPIDGSARFALGDRIYVEGRGSFSPIGDVKAVDLGGGGSLCAVTWTGKGRILLSESLVSTHWTMVPGAARNCLGIGGEVILQHYAVNAQGPTDTVWYAADTAVVAAGFHKLMREDVAIRKEDGSEYAESAIKKIYVEAMFAPAVHADLPMGATEPKYKKWGGRIGVDHSYGDGKLGWAYRVELGAFPGGGETIRAYLLITVGVSFSL